MNGKESQVGGRRQIGHILMLTAIEIILLCRVSHAAIEWGCISMIRIFVRMSGVFGTHTMRDSDRDPDSEPLGKDSQRLKIHQEPTKGREKSAPCYHIPRSRIQKQKEIFPNDESYDDINKVPIA